MAAKRLGQKSVGAISRSHLLPSSNLSRPLARAFSSTIPPAQQDLRPASSQIFTPEQVQSGIAALTSAGYDASTIWEQRVVWGDHDQFQHVNNVHFVRWFESARMFFANTLSQTEEFTEKRREEINRGTGKSFILAGINVRYRRPVVYPDTVSFSWLLQSGKSVALIDNDDDGLGNTDSRRSSMRTSTWERSIHP